MRTSSAASGLDGAAKFGFCANMNYRHAFHAGNFADVVKHATLVRILVHLREKPAPFRVIDTHAGSGRYDLTSEEARRSEEWRGGIGPLIALPRRALLAPYLDAVAACNAAGALTVYPGSPFLVRAFLRAADRLIACELEPGEAAALARNLRGDPRCKALAIDGWVALKGCLPPKERRGLVLIDPPFEETDDFARVATALERAHRKWSNGIYLLWYPLKSRERADALARRLRMSDIPRTLRAELHVPRTAGRLNACGLVIVNPPWRLERELALLLPEIAAALGPGGKHHLDWLARGT